MDENRRIEVTGLRSAWWDNGADGTRKLAICITTPDGDAVLLMDKATARHLSDQIWAGQL